MATLLLTGATGLLGGALLPYLRDFATAYSAPGAENSLELITPGRDQMDFTRPGAVYEKICRLQPQIIVNAAGYTAVERAEHEEALATLINGTAVKALAQAAHAVGALLIHYSTDYVFDGKPIGPVRPYLETDPCNPINAYGRSKLLGECYIQASGCDALTVRTAWLYGVQGRHFVNTMLHKALRGETLRVVANQRGTPTSVSQVAQLTRMLLDEAHNRRQQGTFKSTLLHATAAGQASWYEFAREIVVQAQRLTRHEKFKRILEACVITRKKGQDVPDKKRGHWSPFLPAGLQRACAARPPYSVLANRALESYLGGVRSSNRCHWRVELIRTLEPILDNTMHSFGRL